MTGPFTPNRRQVLTLTGTGLLGSALGPIRLSFAAGPADRPLILILLRGGLDGQALLPIHGDPAYASQRGLLALPTPDSHGGVIDLDGRIGLHPAADMLLPFWTRGQMAIASAVASPYRGNSHAEAQAVLESGLAAHDPQNQLGGWLNRAIAASGAASTPGSPSAIAISPNLPLVLQGTATSEPWTPPDLPGYRPGYYEKAALLYGTDPLFANALGSGQRARSLRQAAMGPEHVAADTAGIRAQDLAFAAEIVGRAISSEGGPGTAVIEVGGFDTHTQQGALEGPLSRRIAGLAAGLSALADALGGRWDQTMIVAISEFGRSLRPNGTGGTDHGLGGVALVLGGSLSAARHLGAVPKLAPDALAPDGGLPPGLDSRALFKAVLAKHWGLSRATLDARVFPGSGSIAPLEGL